MTVDNKYRPELDGIRGIAVGIVVLSHFAYDPGWAGLLGVTLFFVLSGYLISGLLIAERMRTGTVALRAFYARRMRRLMPALVALVVACLVLELPGNPIAALTYTTNAYILATGDPGGSLRHTWSLAVEEQFYLVWPVLFLALGRWRVPFLVVSVIAAAFIDMSLVNAGIVMGCLIAVAGLRLPSRWAWIGWAGLAVVAFTPIADYRLSVALGTVAAAVIVGTGGGITWRPLIRLGQISYGLYLWHFPVAMALKGFTTGPDTTTHAVVAVAGILVSLLLALLSEQFIERPFRRYAPPDTLIWRMKPGMALPEPPAPA